MFTHLLPDDHLAWVKEHQKRIVDEIVSGASAIPGEKPIAIFMAGLPGAGKTELTYGLIEQSSSKLVRLDMDELATMIEDYKPEIADEFHKAATRLLDATFDKVIKKRLDFIMDGTFGSPKAVQNVERVVKRGYDVQIVCACQDPKLAWEFTMAREKVEHRAISEDGFLEVYYKTIDNLHMILSGKYDNVLVDIFIKNRDNTVGRQFLNVKDEQVDEIMGVIYNKNRLKEYIEGKS